MLQQASQFSFDGNGFVLKGYVKCDDEDYVANVEMYIDGELVETANLPVAKASSIDDRRVDLFHKYQLEDMEHTVVLEWKILIKCTDLLGRSACICFSITLIIY